MKKAMRQAWDDQQIERAVSFTTSRFLGRGVFDTRPFGTQGEAFADARGDRRAIVYAVTPEGFTIHITNGDAIAMETTMTTTTYTTKNDAVRAARAALKAKHRDPLSGVHFRLDAVGDEWAWHEIDLGTGAVALGELLEDGVNPDPKPALPPVTVVPAQGRAAPKAAKAATTTKPVKEPSKREAARMAKIAAADAANKAKANEPKAAKAPKAPRVPGAPKTSSKKAEMLAAAERGEMPTPPDFTADTHKRFRPVLQKLVDAAAAGDLKVLKADTTQPLSSSRVALCRYRDLAITALEAQRKAAKAQQKVAA